MFDLNRKQYLSILGAAVILFIINNIVLGSIIPRLPGGSAFDITTMFTVTLSSLIIKRFGCIPIIYFIYGIIGLISHLLASDWLYSVSVVLLIVSAAIFDWYLYNKNYKISYYYIAFPFFIILTNVLNFIFAYLFKGERPIIEFKVGTFSLSLILGYAGITLAYILLAKKQQSI